MLHWEKTLKIMEVYTGDDRTPAQKQGDKKEKWTFSIYTIPSE